jgi:hypothetical protein
VAFSVDATQSLVLARNLVGLTSMCFQEKVLWLLGTRNFRCPAIFVRRQVYLVHVLNRTKRFDHCLLHMVAMIEGQRRRAS